VSAEQEALTQLINAVISSAKYGQVAPELVCAIGAQELSKRRNLKEAIKATKNKLHQTVGAYWSGKPAYAAWLTALRTAPDPDSQRAACETMLRQHASTRERLPLLDEFYPTLFADLLPIRSILDLACGLNPLTIPWMPLAPDARYHACDVDAEQVGFLQQALPLLGVQGTASVCDLLQPFTAPAVEVVLLLKTLPCLEQIDKSVSARLVTRLHAPVIIISYPAQSLGGRNKGMVQSYRTHFQQLFPADDRQIQEFVFPTEIVFRLVKHAQHK